MSWRMDLGELPVGWEIDRSLDVIRKNYTVDLYPSIPRNMKAEIIIHENTPEKAMMTLVPMIGPPGRIFSKEDRMPGYIFGANTAQVQLIDKLASAIDDCVENGKAKEEEGSLTVELKDLLEAIIHKGIATDLLKPTEEEEPDE